jgi:hypothetical protein
MKKDRENLDLICEITDKELPKKENWFKDLKNYQADTRILKDKEPVIKN